MAFVALMFVSKQWPLQTLVEMHRRPNEKLATLTLGSWLSAEVVAGLSQSTHSVPTLAGFQTRFYLECRGCCWLITHSVPTLAGFQTRFYLLLVKDQESRGKCFTVLPVLLPPLAFTFNFKIMVTPDPKILITFLARILEQVMTWLSWSLDVSIYLYLVTVSQVIPSTQVHGLQSANTYGWGCCLRQEPQMRQMSFQLQVLLCKCSRLEAKVIGYSS